MITDSGGFQVFSLGKQVGTVKDGLKGKQKKRYHDTEASCLVRLKEDGAVFRSYRNGERITLTPETSVSCKLLYWSDKQGRDTEEVGRRHYHSFGLAASTGSK